MSKLSRLIERIKTALASNEEYIALLRKKGVTIGSGCSISKEVVFGTEPYLITLGDNVRVIQNVRFITHDGSLWVPRNMGLVDKKADKYGRITVGNNVNIGMGATILPGVRIGSNCIIGAGSIVTHDVPDGSVVAGVPARVIETVEGYVKKNKEKILLTKGMPEAERKALILSAMD